MKKINYLAFLMLLGLSVIFTGCDDEESAEPADTIVNITTNTAGNDGNTIPNAIISFDYTIAVSGICSCGPCKTDALDGASITLNGETKTTDASGMVTFEDLRAGNVVYFIEREGYASMTVHASLGATFLTPQPISDTDQNYNANMNIAMFKKDASVSGQVLAPWTNTSSFTTTVPSAYNPRMLLNYEIVPSAYNAKYNPANTLSSIINVVLHVPTYRTNLTSDARFEFTGVPTAPIGSGLNAKVDLEPVVVGTGTSSYRVYLPTAMPSSGIKPTQAQINANMANNNQISSTAGTVQGQSAEGLNCIFLFNNQYTAATR